MYIWNISSLVQLDISPVSAIELNSRREIPYLRAPVDYSLFLLHFNLICNNICNRTARKAQFYWIISIVNCAIFLPLMIQTVARTRSNTSDGLFQNPFCLPLASFYLSTGFCVPRRKPSSAKSELLTQNVLSPYSRCYIWIITLRFLSRNF